jgi:hypothetical protein
LNPSDKDKALLEGFKITLKRWIEKTTPKGIAINSIPLDTHYMYDRVNDMVDLLEVIDKMESTLFL